MRDFRWNCLPYGVRVDRKDKSYTLFNRRHELLGGPETVRYMPRLDRLRAAAGKDPDGEPLIQVHENEYRVYLYNDASVPERSPTLEREYFKRLARLGKALGSGDGRRKREAVKPVVSKNGQVRWNPYLETGKVVADWRFYGRDAELEESRIRLHLDIPDMERRFGSYYITGRRGIGKSELAREIIQRVKDDTPSVFLEIKSKSDVETCLNDLLDHIDKAGLDHLLASLPPQRRHQTDKSRFAAIIHHLLGQGAVVIIDEFQRGSENGIVGEIAAMLNHIRNGREGPKPSGKLVMMGSHQQRMIELFSDDGPLYGRAQPLVKLGQWTVRTVMEMAAEHGLLSRPGRFHTLWSAYGGVPLYWQRFVAGDDISRIRDYHAVEDDDDWRRRFLKAELRLLHNSSERFDSRAIVTLAPDLRRVVYMLGRRPGRGMTAAEIVEAVRHEVMRTGRALEPGDIHVGQIEDGLWTLRKHLQLVVPDNPILDASPRKWRIFDLNSLFQLRVFPELFNPEKEPGEYIDGETDEAVVDMDMAMERLREMEGHTLERFAANWIKGKPDSRWCRHAAQLGPDPDVDVLAVMEDAERDPVALLGACKRNPKSHRPGKVLRDFERFLDMIGRVDDETKKRCRWPTGEMTITGPDGEELTGAWPGVWHGKRPGKSYRRHLAISPEIPEAERMRLTVAGFECHDIVDMARDYGIRVEGVAGRLRR